MIKYALICDKAHDFESWFADSAAYDKQTKRKLIACPQCNSVKVGKALMTPRLSATARKRRAPAAPAPEAPQTPAPAAPVAMISAQEQAIRSKLKELRDHLTKNADNVGAKFPEEARKMHYGEIEHRSIYGVASPKEAKDLVDEGVEVHPLPNLPDEQN